MHREEYKGYTITVDVLKRGRGWTWSYQINGGPLRTCKDRPQSIKELALSEAVGEAEFEIDKMENQSND